MYNQFFVTRDSEIRFFTILAIGLSFLFAISFLLGIEAKTRDASKPTQSASTHFPEVVLQAKSAYVYDARTQTVLYALNENTRIPLASLTKIMSALVASELSPAYGTVKVSREALVVEGDSGLRPGEKWSLKNILDFSLVSSSNDGIRAVALSLGALRSADASDTEIVGDFVRTMNAKAAELDLKNTYFWNETGLDESEYKGGAYGTSKDMTTLLEYIIQYHPELFEATREVETTITSLDNYKHVAKNTNHLVGEIPGLLASKTGFTSTAGGNLIFAFDPELGRPIIITILGSTVEGRFEDAKKLVNATLDYLNNQ
ncbi:MAG: D-alanyl-D-alanine carboxypeptidase [Candidatus Zambryskibacteria bacterium]|nr:D-alanyl-D-alanine carboxypeptidase [Candidatus Zambryskibacteria bacterium]